MIVINLNSIQCNQTRSNKKFNNYSVLLSPVLVAICFQVDSKAASTYSSGSYPQLEIAIVEHIFSMALELLPYDRIKDS